MQLINIQTSDGEIIEVERFAARQSQIIRKMLDDLPIEEKIFPIKEPTATSLIPISNEKVTGLVFKKALVWMENNRGYPNYKKDENDEILNMAIPVMEFSRKGYKIRFWLKINCNQMKSLSFVNCCNEKVSKSLNLGQFSTQKKHSNLSFSLKNTNQGAHFLLIFFDNFNF